MIRLAWRQFRAQVAVAVGALLAVAVALAIIGQPRVGQYQLLTGTLNVALYVAPALVGMFWGAPLLSRELETGTFRLVWTQGITRRRWLLVKIALVGLTSIVAVGLLSLMVTWEHAPVEAVTLNRIAPGVFDVRGIVAAGYAAFAFALGAMTGALLRRTLPAMAATLLVFAAVRVLVAEWVRVHFVTPLTYPTTGTAGSGPSGWIVSQATNVIRYQPESRFWAFQWYETGLFLGLAVVLAASCLWWVQRRLD